MHTFCFGILVTQGKILGYLLVGKIESFKESIDD